MSREVVNAISEYYHQKGIQEFYEDLAAREDEENVESLKVIAEKHEKLAENAYAYIVVTFKEQMNNKPNTIKEHLTGMH